MLPVCMILWLTIFYYMLKCELFLIVHVSKKMHDIFPTEILLKPSISKRKHRHSRRQY